MASKGQSGTLIEGSTAERIAPALVRGRIYNRAKGGEGRPKKLGKSCPVSEGSTAETLAPKLGVSAQPLPPKPRCPADVDV